MTLLRTPIDLRGEDFKTLSDFTVSEGQTVPFVLSFGRSYRERPASSTPLPRSAIRKCSGATGPPVLH